MPLRTIKHSPSSTGEYDGPPYAVTDEQGREIAWFDRQEDAEKFLDPRGTGQAGHAWSDITASAYRAYAASTGNKNFRGEPMPAFDALSPAIQTAWEAAVRQADRCVHTPASEGLPDESRWAGWLPPRLTD